MTLTPFPGFEHFPTHHCITGSLRHLYVFHGAPISEEMLLGLGAGVGFVYWHTRGSLPFLGGRANVGRANEEGLEKTSGRRTGVRVECLRTGSPARAERMLLQRLESGQPAMLMVDMGFLPYFDFGGEEYHFGGHALVVCGYDPETRQALIADRDQELHPVALADLARARGSTYQPFPPRNALFEMDFSAARAPLADEVREAILTGAAGMLEPPITNLGVKGIRKASQRMGQWPSIMPEPELRGALFNTAIMIDARAGTGGGLFRLMYARFLLEAAALLGPESGLEESAARMQALGGCWQDVCALLEEAFAAADPVPAITQARALLLEIAEREEEVWGEIRDQVLRKGDQRAEIRDQ